MLSLLAETDQDMHHCCGAACSLPAGLVGMQCSLVSVSLLVVQVRASMLAKNTELDLYMLAYHAGVTMQVLAEMAATPLFYHRSA